MSILTVPVDYVHYQWLQYRKDNLYRLAHNSQKCYLRGALNDRFDNVLRRIRIDDGNGFKRKYIYTDGELSGTIFSPQVFVKPTYLGTLFLYDDSDYEDTGVDFIVVVPQDLQFSIFEMNALIDFYKLASKRYKIIRE
ncbi:hypothetical protein [Chryseobacterium sp. R2A-55]|uniref:hypothetical protein n=1 Tax=Chryseobacterium sp. R2A-55 TaxID=2744445 RepID=UPI001F1D0898|nr:hypothetical protein [Chryseobacterium sp. R2A-55]